MILKFSNKVWAFLFQRHFHQTPKILPPHCSDSFKIIFPLFRLCRFEKYISGKYLGEVSLLSSLLLLFMHTSKQQTTINFKIHASHSHLDRFVVSSCETCVTRVCCFRTRQRSFFRHRGNLAPTMYHTLKSEYTLSTQQSGREKGNGSNLF